jgi:hypothetical protein
MSSRLPTYVTTTVVLVATALSLIFLAAQAQDTHIGFAAINCPPSAQSSGGDGPGC